MSFLEDVIELSVKDDNSETVDERKPREQKKMESKIRDDHVPFGVPKDAANRTKTLPAVHSRKIRKIEDQIRRKKLDKIENHAASLSIPSIPKIIIRPFASDENLEENIKKSVEKFAPDWEELVLSIDAVDEYVNTKYCQFKTQFLSLSTEDRLEVGKYLYLYEYGGLCIGKDYMLTTSIDNLFYDEANLYLFKSSWTSYAHTNEFLGSKPAHPFCISLAKSYLGYDYSYKGFALVARKTGNKHFYYFNETLGNSNFSHSSFPSSYVSSHTFDFTDNISEPNFFFAPAGSFFSHEGALDGAFGFMGSLWWVWLIVILVLVVFIYFVARWYKRRSEFSHIDKENWMGNLKELNEKINGMSKNFLTSNYNYGLEYKNMISGSKY